MKSQNFPTELAAIRNRIDEINPVKYAQTRNFIDGAVTYLSPYISRGVISCRQVMNAVFSKGFTQEQSEKLIQELAWREYYQRVWQYLEDDMFEDIRQKYTGIRHKELPLNIWNAATGVVSVDNAIKELYQTGYMHNHLRMYTASMVCNIAKAHWQLPSRWMYYHLLDGDLASNTCSWQWVAGTFSAKQYYCNQENINKYTGTNQRYTFLDKGYDELPGMQIPEELQEKIPVKLTTSLPVTGKPLINPELPLLLYNSYNLDPEWRKDTPANRVLILEPSHFRQYPVSSKVIDFIISLADNIEGIQIMTGEVNEIPEIGNTVSVYSKIHPAFKHYPGKKDEYEWMFPEVTGFHNSFFGFWKKCERLLKKKQLPLFHMVA